MKCPSTGQISSLVPRFRFIGGSLVKDGTTFCSFPCLYCPLGTAGLLSRAGWFPCTFPMGRDISAVVTLEFITTVTTAGNKQWEQMGFQGTAIPSLSEHPQ